MKWFYIEAPIYQWLLSYPWTEYFFLLCFIYLLQDISKFSGLKEVHFISFMIPWYDWVVFLLVLSWLTHVAASNWWSFCNQGSGEIFLLGLLSQVSLWHDSLKVNFQENKPQCTSLYQASGYVLLTDVPWPKQVSWSSPESLEGGHTKEWIWRGMIHWMPLL